MTVENNVAYTSSISLFNGISTFLGYLMPKATLLEE